MKVAINQMTKLPSRRTILIQGLIKLLNLMNINILDRNTRTEIKIEGVHYVGPNSSAILRIFFD